jgi:hypothetical protein
LRPCGGRFERDELQYAAVEAFSDGVAVVIVVTVVPMRMFRIERGAGRNGADAVITGSRAMKGRCRPRELERQHDQQEEDDETFHGGRV